MSSPHVYDKAEYHHETIEEYGLHEEHGANHTVVFLRWLIENDLMDKSFVMASGDALKEFQAATSSIHKVYGWWDNCLSSDMLTVEGNEFALYYFDFSKGAYLQDYTEMFQGALPSEFHVDYTEANYQRMKLVIDRRFKEWGGIQEKVDKEGQNASGSKGKTLQKRWWPF